MPSPCNELHEFLGHRRGVFFIMRRQKKINMRKQLRSCTAPNHWCSSAKDTLREEKWIQLKMLCDQQREEDGGEKVQFTSCSCCLLPYCKWCNGNASAHSSLGARLLELHEENACQLWWYQHETTKNTCSFLKGGLGAWSGSRLCNAKDKTKTQKQSRGKLNACSSFWSEVAFFFPFSLFLKLSEQRPAPLFVICAAVTP